VARTEVYACLQPKKRNIVQVIVLCTGQIEFSTLTNKMLKTIKYYIYLINKECKNTINIWEYLSVILLLTFVLVATTFTKPTNAKNFFKEPRL